MGYWLGYAKAGREAEVAREIRRLGMGAEVAKQVEAIRRGKKRFAEPVVTALFPNVVVINCTDDRLFPKLAYVRNLFSPYLLIANRTYEREIKPCFAEINTAALKRMRDIRRGKEVRQYEPGEALEILTGAWAGHLAEFEKLDAKGMIHASLRDVQIIGKTPQMWLDPLNVRKAR